MNTKQTLNILLVLTACSFSASTQAQQSSGVEQIVKSFLSSAVESVSIELEQQLLKTKLSAKDLVDTKDVAEVSKADTNTVDLSNKTTFPAEHSANKVQKLLAKSNQNENGDD